MSEWGGLTTRECATVAWLSGLVIVAICRRSVRAELIELIRSFFKRSILLTFATFSLWLFVVIGVGSMLGAWNAGMTKDTVAWFMASGFGVIFAALEVAKQERFFKRAALATVELSVFMQFVLNLYTFPILVELLLLPLLAMLVVLVAFAETSDQYKPALRVFRALLIGASLALFCVTAIELAHHADEIDAKQTALDLAFSIWLPLAALPFVFGLAVVMEYGRLLSVLPFRNGREPIARRAKLALVTGLRFDVRAVKDFLRDGEAVGQLVSATRYRVARKAIASYRERRRAALRRAEVERLRLDWYAGARGVREDGSLLDQRELAETRSALRWIHTCQMGWHRRGGSYRADLLSAVLFNDFSRHGLPERHGIALHVSPDGQSWFAWRRAAGGHVLAIGAQGPPPDEWLYDGLEPPEGFPGADPAWGDEPFSLPRQWH